LEAKGLDFSQVLFQPEVPTEVGRFCTIAQDHGLEKRSTTRVLLRLCEPAIERKEKVVAALPIRNVESRGGTIVGSEITRRWARKDCPRTPSSFISPVSAGAEFLRVHAQGMTFTLEGDRERLRSAKAYRAARSSFIRRERPPCVTEENIIVATSRSTARPAAKPTFAAWPANASSANKRRSTRSCRSHRDHGCEYMTGGPGSWCWGWRGGNFAAGMSRRRLRVERFGFSASLHLQMGPAWKSSKDADESRLVEMIQSHQTYTRSARATQVLAAWNEMTAHIRKSDANKQAVLESLKQACRHPGLAATKRSWRFEDEKTRRDVGACWRWVKKGEENFLTQKPQKRDNRRETQRVTRI